MPVITIARQLGAGGKILAEMVAKELGYAFYDNEIIQLVAEKANVSKEAVTSAENNTTSKFMKFISGIVPRTFVDRAREGDKAVLDEVIYVDLLGMIIKDLAKNDNVVILGRGGQYILSNDKNTFHFLLIGEKKHRIKFLSDRYQLTYLQAESAIDAEDKRRENLYARFGKDDYDQWNNYHMIINMGINSLDTATSQICSLVQ